MKSRMQKASRRRGMVTLYLSLLSLFTIDIVFLPHSAVASYGHASMDVTLSAGRKRKEVT
jgi:hypothetical protein